MSVPTEAVDAREWEHTVVEDAGLEIVGIELRQSVTQLVVDGTRGGSSGRREEEPRGKERQHDNDTRPEARMRNQDSSSSWEVSGDRLREAAAIIAWRIAADYSGV